MPPPSLPAVALQGRDVRDLCRQMMSIRDVRSTTVLQGPYLSVRPLFISASSCKTKTPGRGGKAERRKCNGSWMHESRGAVLGSTLGDLIEFVTAGGARSAPAAVRQMRELLSPAARDAAGVHGHDGSVLLRGFACHTVIRSQSLQSGPPRKRVRLHRRLGKETAIVGLAAAAFFALSFAEARCEGPPSALAWLRDCIADLGRGFGAAMGRAEQRDDPEWRTEIRDAVSVEARALDRAVEGLIAARRHAERWKPESRAEERRLELDCMRRAVWPRGREVSEQTQAELLDWIQSPDFAVSSPDAHGATRECDLGDVPLCLLGRLLESAPCARRGEDTASCSEGSSLESLGSLGSLASSSGHSSAGSVSDGWDAGEQNFHSMSLSLGSPWEPR